MKPARKRLRRLKRRVADWELIKEDGFAWGGRVKLLYGAAYRKPGSQKK